MLSPVLETITDRLRGAGTRPRSWMAECCKCLLMMGTVYIELNNMKYGAHSIYMRYDDEIRGAAELHMHDIDDEIIM